MIRRDFYKDTYNGNKVWEVATLSGGYYLRQYICGKQFGRGVRTTKRKLKEIGILQMEKL